MKALSKVSRTGSVGSVLFLLLFGVPVVMHSGFRLQELEYVLAVTMIAVGLNVVTGFAGQLALGPGGIFGVAGYAAAVLASHHPAVIGLALMCLIGLVAASVVGLVVGIPALRVGGFYLGMATLALAALVPVVANEWNLVGGSYGVNLIGLSGFHPELGGVPLYEVTVAVLFVITLGSWALLHSRVGHRFLALANSEDLAASLGISGFRTKLLSFLISAWPAGLGGAFYVYTQQFFSSGSPNTNLSIYVLAACVIGGFGSVLGPIFGGLVVFGLSEFLSGLQEWQGVIFAVMLAGFAILLPEGVMGFVEGPASGRRQLPWTAGLRRAFNGRRVATDHGERLALTDVLTKSRRAEPSPGGSGRSVLQPSADGDLELRGVEIRFGGVRAVDGVDLAVRRGTVHALIGSNGSGKTTILNLISGLYRLNAGEILLGSQRLDTRKAYEVARLGVGRTFQTPKLLARETVLANVLSAVEMHAGGNSVASVLRLPSGRRADREARDVALSMIEELGLGDSANLPVALLPHGLRRLVEIARALAASPGVLLLDEPAAGLTHEELDRLGQVISRAADRGVGVLLIEHNVPFVFGLADEVTVLHLGRVIAHGTPEEIRSDEKVAQAFLGSQVELIEPSTRAVSVAATQSRTVRNG
jgi:ABC-type branched-subunit amino acid transport system ATPase component/ABC-type branched-subunit amino acid transport system permease subunit